MGTVPALRSITTCLNIIKLLIVRLKTVIIIIIMSHRTLPILFINLGGEMIYIIDARLKAQSVEKERANKVGKRIK